MKQVARNLMAGRWQRSGALALALLACGWAAFGALPAWAFDAAATPGSGQKAPDATAFTWDQLRQQRATRGGPWLEFLRSHGLYCGVYALAAGASDAQQPHREDEAYYVVRGRAKFAAGSGEAAQQFDAAPGSVLFVAAGVPHHFHSITEELELLVFFTTRQPAATREQVEDVLRRYEQAYRAKDSAALALVYTEDGLFQPPNGAAVRGRAAIAGHWRGRFGDGLVLTLDAFDGDGMAGWAAGTWQLDGRDGGKATGRFTVGLRRGRDGEWRMSYDTYHDAPGG